MAEATRRMNTLNTRDVKKQQYSTLPCAVYVSVSRIGFHCILFHPHIFLFYFYCTMLLTRDTYPHTHLTGTVLWSFSLSWRVGNIWMNCQYSLESSSTSETYHYTQLPSCWYRWLATANMFVLNRLIPIKYYIKINTQKLFNSNFWFGFRRRLAYIKV